MEQEEIAIQVRHKHEEIETTELHATDTPDYEHQETETTELLTTDTPDHATTSDTQEEHQREEEPRVFNAEELRIRTENKITINQSIIFYQSIIYFNTLRQRAIKLVQNTKTCERTKLKAEVGKVNEAVKRI